MALFHGSLLFQFCRSVANGGGALAPTLGPLIGAGPGRGIALMFILTGALYLPAALVLLVHPRIRRVESELPDAIPTHAKS